MKRDVYWYIVNRKQDDTKENQGHSNVYRPTNKKKIKNENWEKH